MRLSPSCFRWPRVTVLLLGGCLLFGAQASHAAFTAYNDFVVWDSDPTFNITTNSFNTAGSASLIDYGAGTPVAVSMTFSPAGGGAYSAFNNPANPPSGSDAYQTFNGIVGLTNYQYQSTGASNIGPYSIQFSGMNSNAAYSFVLYGCRGFAAGSYSNRLTDLTLVGADSFTNNSSAGAAKFTRSTANDSAELSAGNVDGQVWRFDGIKCGSDGAIQFDLYGRGTNGQVASIYLEGFMMQEFGATSGGGSNTTTNVWKQGKVTGVMASTNCTLYMYISNSTGRVYIDDVNMVLGSTAESGANLIVNPGFESGTNGWELVGNHTISQIISSPTHVGANALLLQSTAVTPSGGSADSVKQTVAGLSAGQTHTLSFWYLATNAVDFSVRYSGHPDMAVVTQVGAGGTTTNTSGGGSTNGGSASQGISWGALGPVIINEWMPYNRSFTNNNNGHASSWVELFNTTATNINLNGWRLSDDVSNSNKWTLPASTLNAGSHLLIWMDNESGGAYPHANFDLRTGGGVLALFQSQGQLVDAIEYEAQHSDTSGGRQPSGLLCDTAYPTPGSSNNILEVAHASVSNGVLGLATTTRMGHQYRVEYTTNLLSGNWQTAASFTGNGSSISTSLNTSAASARLYRIVHASPNAQYIPNTNSAPVLAAILGGGNLIKTATLSGDGSDLVGLTNGFMDFDHATYGWTASQLSGNRVRATWASPQTIDRVWIYGAGSIMQGIERGRVWLSDGSVYEFGQVPDRMMVPGLQVSFPARPVSWVEVEVVQARGRWGNPGIGELCIFNGTPGGVTNAQWYEPLSWPPTVATVGNQLVLRPIPSGSPFADSAAITNMTFTGRHIEYEGADTWYPFAGTDGYLYSCYADGSAEGIGVACYNANGTPYSTTTTGNAKIKGDDPMDLQITALTPSSANTGPHFDSRYPCAQLVYNGVWYYGTFAYENNMTNLTWTDANGTHGTGSTGGQLCGFRYSSDGGQSWTDTSPYPRGTNMAEGLFPDTVLDGWIKFGTPHFVDLGPNMQYSPDGYAYLVGDGTMPGQTNRFPVAGGNVGWITGDGIFMARVQPSPANINDVSKWQYFAGLNGTNATWTTNLDSAQPIAWWDNHMGCVTMTYNAPLKKYFMCVIDGRYTGESMDTYIMEGDQPWGPFKMVKYMPAFGEQGYFATIPSKFISADGKKMWLSYSANFGGVQIQPEGSRYAWCLAEFTVNQ